MKPISVKEIKPGVFIFDFGQNFAGWSRLHVKGERGTCVRLRSGELLYPDGTLNGMTAVVGQIKDGGKDYVYDGHGRPKTAFQLDEYILKGKGEEIYTPRFTFHGFRYVEVTGLHIPLIYGGLLHEGDSIRATRALAKAPTQVTIDAMLWSQPVHRVLTVNSEFSRIFAGWVFSEDEATELSQNEKLTVATMAHTVTPVTSFVVTRAGSREEPLSTSGVGSGGSNYSAVDTIGSSNTPHGHLHPDLAALLDHEVKACVAANHPAVGWTRDLTVETTRDEVVDVRSKDTDAMSQCLVEAVWGVRLTAAYTLERDEYALSLH